MALGLQASWSTHPPGWSDPSVRWASVLLSLLTKGWL